MIVDGASADEAVVIVDVEIVLARREELANPFDFAPILRDVRLHEAVRMLGLERVVSVTLDLGARWEESAEIRRGTTCVIRPCSIATIASGSYRMVSPSPH